MDRNEKIYVAGHRGLAGSAVVRRLRLGGYSRIVTRSRTELDLTDQEQVRGFFDRERPQVVFVAAARVGGILANSSFPGDFLYQNLMIECNVVHEAYASGVRKLLFLGSSCIYPKLAPQPLREEYLLTGPLEPTNEAYAVAKIAGIKLCAAYHRQHGANFLSLMPTNLYGPGDNYDLSASHVLPALVRKFCEAKRRAEREVVLWGTGAPRREFLYVDDLADACVFVMERLDASDVGEIVNVGTGEDMSIALLAGLVREAVGYTGDVVFDSSKPDGTPRKLLDVSRLAAWGWRARTPLAAGLAHTLADYRARYEADIAAAPSLVAPQSSATIAT